MDTITKQAGRPKSMNVALKGLKLVAPASAEDVEIAKQLADKFYGGNVAAAIRGAIHYQHFQMVAAPQSAAQDPGFFHSLPAPEGPSTAETKPEPEKEILNG